MNFITNKSPSKIGFKGIPSFSEDENNLWIYRHFPILEVEMDLSGGKQSLST